jgi:hypothetical protein
LADAMTIAEPPRAVPVSTMSPSIPSASIATIRSASVRRLV